MQRSTPFPVSYLFLTLCGWVAALAVAGGASRPDEIQQIVSRLFAIVVIVVILWKPPVARLRTHPGALLFALLCLALPLAQLVPLPFDLWRVLPGHQFYAETAASVGVSGGWRPLALSPDAARNAALSLLPPVATLLLMLAIMREERPKVVYPLLALVTVSVALGILQLAGGTDTWLRFYDVTNTTAAVGVFANRNHHALLTAIGIALVAFAALPFRKKPEWKRFGPTIMIAIIAILLLSALLAGSRAGLLTSGFAVVGSIAMLLRVPVRRRVSTGYQRPPAPQPLLRRTLPWSLPIAALSLLLATAIALGRAPAVDRLLATDQASEGRYLTIEPILQMARSFFPAGSGMGSFAAVYRHFEPVALLSPRYLNEAHNDLLQIIVEGGLPALLLLGLYLAWWCYRSVQLWFASSERGDCAAGLLGTIITGILLLGSLGDYPLRTPLLASIFAIGSVLMLKNPWSAAQSDPR